MNDNSNPDDAALARRKKLRKRIFTVLFILLNIGIIAWTAFSEFGDSESAADLSSVQIKWWLLIPAALMFVVSAYALIAKYELLIRKTHSAPEGADHKTVRKIATNTVMLGRYYDNITPASMGGQPFQIYYMYKNHIKKGFDVAIPLICMITDQLGLLIIGLLTILIGTLIHAIWSPAIVAFGFIGLLVIGFFPLVIMAATFLPQATEEVIGLGVKLLAKLRILKDPEAAEAKAVTSVRQYASGIKTILKEKGLFLRALGFGALYYVATLSVPFFVLSAFGANIDFFACFATTAAVSTAIYIIPTPGNAGAAEGTFYTVFSVLPSAGYVFWAMLFWRFFVYYLWLILGVITQFRIYAEDKNLIKNWNKDVDNLERAAKSSRSRNTLTNNHKLDN